MSKTIYFTPGPSQLYPGVDKFIQQALEEDVASISHRSQQFKDIFKEATDNLKLLLNLPADYHVFFTGSATEIWERILGNFVKERSFHFVNGSFSKKFYSYSVNGGKNAKKHEEEMGKGFEISEIHIDQNVELIAVTQNETSTGVQFPVEDIHSLRHIYPNPIIAVDAVSSLPHPVIDFNKIDTAFFSVQKCFGLPSGLGVWMVNDRCIELAKKLAEEGHIIGPHHTVTELVGKEVDNQTPATPNTLGIYLLAKVSGAMLKKGVDAIREETTQKSELLKAFINESSMFDLAVENELHRSETVIVANTKVPASEINKYLADYDLNIGSGYGSFKTTQVRIANFPAHSVEQTKKLIEVLKTFDKNA